MEINLPTKEREINGTTYKVTTLRLDQWAEFTEFIAAMVGEPIASVLRGDAVAKRNLAMSDLEVMIADLSSKLTKKSIIALAAHLARGVYAEGSLLTVEKQQTWWPHHMRDLALVVGFFLECQYLDFFEGLGDLKKLAEEAAVNRAAKTAS